MAQFPEKANVVIVGLGGIVGASAGSLFVFKGAYKAVLINYPTLIQRD